MMSQNNYDLSVCFFLRIRYWQVLSRNCMCS